MRIDHLYERLDYIINTYSNANNEYIVDENNHPEIIGRFDFFDTKIYMTKKDDYIELSIKALYNYCLNVRNEIHFIRVYEDDSVKHDFSLLQKDLLGRIIYYFANDLSNKPPLNKDDSSKSKTHKLK